MYLDIVIEYYLECLISPSMHAYIFKYCDLLTCAYVLMHADYDVGFARPFAKFL
jgi:hypothetical protein